MKSKLRKLIEARRQNRNWQNQPHDADGRWTNEHVAAAASNYGRRLSIRDELRNSQNSQPQHQVQPKSQKKEQILAALKNYGRRLTVRDELRGSQSIEDLPQVSLQKQELANKGYLTEYTTEDIKGGNSKLKQQLQDWAEIADKKMIGVDTADEDISQQDAINYDNKNVVEDIQYSISHNSSNIVIRDNQNNLQSAAIYEEKKDHIYLEFLATAPWNLDNKDPRKVKGAGTAALEQLALKALKAGHGKISLFSMRNAISYYKKIGFVPEKPDNDQSLVLNKQATQEFLRKRGHDV